jgi:hypothetical protein
MNTKPLNRLEIKKTLDWELWLVSPAARTKIGSFTSLEELNQVQITLYRAWERARYPRHTDPLLTRQ